jgi:hypothetical protein
MSRTRECQLSKNPGMIRREARWIREIKDSTRFSLEIDLNHINKDNQHNYWGCEGDHLYKDCAHKGERMMTIHNIQEDDTMDNMGRGMPMFYASFDNRKIYYQSHMIEVECKINNYPIAILIDFGASNSYIDPKIVERFKLKRCKHEKYWLV